MPEVSENSTVVSKETAEETFKSMDTPEQHCDTTGVGPESMRKELSGFEFEDDDTCGFVSRSDQEKTQQQYCLKMKGMDYNDKVGFTFPDIDPAAFKNPVPRKNIPIKMHVGKIGANGTIIITFNQEMLSPRTIRQKVY